MEGSAAKQGADAQGEGVERMGRRAGSRNRSVREQDRDLEGTWSRCDDGISGLETRLNGHLLRVSLAAKGTYLAEAFNADGKRLVAIRFPKASEAKEFLMERAETMSMNGKTT